MTKPAKTPGPLKLRIIAACLLGAVGFAVVTQSDARLPVGVEVLAAFDVAVAGLCLWLAHRLDQARRDERRPKN
jgi:hypothetical protein